MPSWWDKEFWTGGGDKLPQTAFAPFTQAAGQQAFQPVNPWAQNQQQDFIRALQQRAAGQGVSPAEIIAQQQLNKNQAASASAINSVRGINPGVQAKMILDQQAQANQQAAGQTSLLRAKEQLGSQALLGSALSDYRGQDLGQRGQDIGLFGTAGGLENQQKATEAGITTAGMQQTGQVVGGALGGLGAAAMLLLSQGGKVAGTAKASGDSAKNDTVPAMLSPGEVVLPRSVANDPEAAAAFVRAIRRRRDSGSGGGGYGRVLEASRRAYWRGGQAAC